MALQQPMLLTFALACFLLTLGVFLFAQHAPRFGYHAFSLKAVTGQHRIPTDHSLDPVDTANLNDKATLYHQNSQLILLTATDIKEGSPAWLCIQSLEKINLTNFVILAFNNTGDVFEPPSKLEGHVVHIRRPPKCAVVYQFGIRSELSCQRLAYLLLLLRAGYDILNSDSDIVFFSSPWQHFSHLHDVQSMSDAVWLEQAFGYPVQTTGDKIDPIKPAGHWESHVNHLNIGCTFVRSTPASISFFFYLVDLMQREQSWEQMVFNQEAFSSMMKGNLLLKVLDPFKFTNSGFYANFNKSETDSVFLQHSPVMLHASHAWMFGLAKYDVLKQAVDFYADRAMTPYEGLNHRFDYGGSWGIWKYPPVPTAPSTAAPV